MFSGNHLSVPPSNNKLAADPRRLTQTAYLFKLNTPSYMSNSVINIKKEHYRQTPNNLYLHLRLSAWVGG